MSVYDREYYEKNKETIRARKRAYWHNRADKERATEKAKIYHKIWYAKNKDKVQAKHRAFRMANPNTRKVETQRRISRLEQLAGRPRPETCEVCGSASFQIVFDHDHKTGKFRGWICYACNISLGHMRDSKEALLRLVEYLENSEKADNNVPTSEGRKRLLFEEVPK